MKTTTMIITTLATLAMPAYAQDTDRGAQNKAAVRRMFPIVSVFDRSKPASQQADRKVDATGTVSWAEGADATNGVDRYGAVPAIAHHLHGMDVAGVRLGMAPSQAEAALRSNGYHPVASTSYKNHVVATESYDYATRLNNSIAQLTRNYAITKSTEAIDSEKWEKDGGQTVTVNYTAMREGQRASWVQYNIPQARLGWNDLKTTVTGKYGAPTRLSEGLHTIRYCGDGECNALDLKGKFASLIVDGQWDITLSDNGAAREAQEAQIKADAEGRIAKTARPSF